MNTDKTRLNAISPVSLSWLIKMRWLAVSFQVLTVGIAYFGLHVTLPLIALGLLIALAALSNYILQKLQPHLSGSGLKLFAGILVLDIALLTGLLYFTGGSSNPFSVLYLVHVALASMTLIRPWSWFVAAFSIFGFGLLFFFHQDLPGASAMGNMHDFSAHLKGMWLAFAVAATLIAYLVSGLLDAFRKKADEVAAARVTNLENQRLLALTTLAAGAAHELNTPLSTIAVIAKDLEGGAGVESAETQNDLRLIRKEVERCRSIIEQLGTANQAQYSGKDPSGEEMSLKTFLTQLQAELSDSEKARCEFLVKSAHDKFPTAELALEKILLNLLRNALDASAAHQKVQLLVRDQKQVLEFIVEDQGSGMSSEILARAFEPFFTTKEPGHGMGLGLFLARQLSERLGGTIVLDSIPGKGTRAVLQMPLGEGHAA